MKGGVRGAHSPTFLMGEIKMFQIKLTVKGKEKTYRAAGMSLRASLDAYALYREYSQCEGDYSPDLIERCIAFIVRLFGGAFTEDELLDGYGYSAFALIPEILSAAIQYANDAIVNFPQPATETPERTKKG